MAEAIPDQLPTLPEINTRLPTAQMLPQSAAMEEVLQLLGSDSGFATSVAAANTSAAAVAALLFVKQHWKTVASALKVPHSHHHPSNHGQGAHAATSPTHRRSSDGAWRPGAGAADGANREFRKGDRVVVVGGTKKIPVPAHLVGKEGVVLAVRGNGWLKLAVGSETLEVQQRYVAYVPAGGLAGRGGLHRTTSTGGGLRGPGGLGRKDLVKGIRKELAALEEQVPWSKVTDRWRTARRGWVRRVKTVEAVRDLALLMRELADALRVPRGAGTLWAPGGEWEVALRELCMGQGPPAQLAAVWRDMSAALSAWLAADQAPGSSGGYDRSTQRRALATARVLLAAAAAGGDALEQVPLDLILTSQRDVLALQAIIQQQLAAAQAHLAAAAAAEAGEAGAAGEGAAAAAADGGGEGAAAAEAAAKAASTVAGLLRVEGLVEGGQDDTVMVDQDLDSDPEDGPDVTDLEGEEWY